MATTKIDSASYHLLKELIEKCLYESLNSLDIKIIQRLDSADQEIRISKKEVTK